MISESRKRWLIQRAKEGTYEIPPSETVVESGLPKVLQALGRREIRRRTARAWNNANLRQHEEHLAICRELKK